jgi:hypothetical protein
MEVAMEPDKDILHCCQIGKEANILIGAGDSKTNDSVWKEAHQRMVIEKDFSLFGSIEARDAIKEGCLAGAVRSDDAMDAFLPEVDIEVTYGHQPAKAFRHFFRKKKGHIIFRST